MGNLKVSRKLLLSFLITVLMTAIVGGIGINGIITENLSSAKMFELNTAPLPLMSKAIEVLQRMGTGSREYAIYSLEDNQAAIDSNKKSIDGYVKIFNENLDQFSRTIQTDLVRQEFDRGRNQFNNGYVQHLDRLYDMAKRDDYDAITAELASASVMTENIVAAFDKSMELKVANAASTNANNDAQAVILLMIIIAVTAAAIAVALILSRYLSAQISNPIIPFTEFMKRASFIGDIALSPEDMKTIGAYAKRKDELGQLIATAAAFVGRITEVSNILETIANGDLSVDIKLLSDADVMGKSLYKMLENLNGMFTEIKNSSTQVSVGAKHMADGSQALAQGSSEQAATIHDLSISIANIANKTKENAEMALQTARLSISIKDSAEKGNHQMNDMMSAVKDINDASQSISKIIKTIDDIAFQTNILALNAAVEAARAGQHGKGFAVVAEEVRNLASKSAEAAKDTGNMIQNSIDKAGLGTRIAGETAASLSEIVTGINESSQYIEDISESSKEQSQGISQLETGIDQVAQVIQQNSATAQQSAAASQEMNGQSDMLLQLISQFTLKESAAPRRGANTQEISARKRIAMPERPALQQVSGGFDKY